MPAAHLPLANRQFRECWPGPVGSIQLLFDAPEVGPRALALIAHPHPLLGGTAEHKVPAILASSLRERGWLSVRPSFRGSGGTEGLHDHGLGETDDLVAIAQQLRARYPRLPLVLIGFSFGAFVQANVARRLADIGQPAARLVVVGTALGEVRGRRSYDTGTVPADTLVIHGEIDDRVSLHTVLRWAEPQKLPVIAVAGADHFFSGRLPVLSRIVCEQLAAITAGSG